MYKETTQVRKNRKTTVQISKSVEWDVRSGPVANIPCSQCKGPRFDPWSEN